MIFCRGRSPHGERGLKYDLVKTIHTKVVSLPTRGAWIEMLPPVSTGSGAIVAPHTGSVD